MASSILAVATTSKIYADAQIVIDPVTQTISVIDTASGSTTTGAVNTGSITTGAVNTGKITTGSIVTPVVTTPSWKATSGAGEFENALSRLFFHKITKYENASGFRSLDNLTREEAAKMMVQAYTALKFPQTIKNTNCTFSDAKTFNPELSGYIAQACQRGLMKGNK